MQWDDIIILYTLSLLFCTLGLTQVKRIPFIGWVQWLAVAIIFMVYALGDKLDKTAPLFVSIYSWIFLAYFVMQAGYLYSKKNRELIAELCTRTSGHDGPCNGYPRKDCKTLDNPNGDVL